MPYEQMTATTCNVHRGDNRFPYCPLCLQRDRDLYAGGLREILRAWEEAGKATGPLPEELHRALAEARELLDGKRLATLGKR